MNVDINLDDWVSWAYKNGIDEKIIAFLRFRPELLFDFDPAHNPVAFPSPRSWQFVHNALIKFFQICFAQKVSQFVFAHVFSPK